MKMSLKTIIQSPPLSENYSMQFTIYNLLVLPHYNNYKNTLQIQVRVARKPIDDPRGLYETWFRHKVH